MVVHSFHLATLPQAMTARALVRPPSAAGVPGLRHAECLATMQLGAPTVSPARMQLRRLALFAEWESETSLDDFLAGHDLGRRVADGWHVRLQFLRRWGQISAMSDLPARADTWDLEEPVVAVTLARMKLLQVPRFLKWGKPVERLVRDHPGTTLALAAMRPPRTICTFSVWHTVREMTEMVHGHSRVSEPQRHAVAMKELRRKDFHHEFVTLRFRALEEHGEWEGRRGIVPGCRSRP
jgi:hypothetical protein